MPIGFDCEGCGKCDECLGIHWQINPKPFTKKEINIVSRFGKVLGQHFDKELADFLR